MELIINPCGDIRCIYDETFDLSLLGKLHIKRASHVEPNEDGCWMVDLSPLNGPVLGPYAWRSEALRVERKWIEENRLTLNI